MKILNHVNSYRLPRYAHPRQHSKIVEIIPVTCLPHDAKYYRFTEPTDPKHSPFLLVVYSTIAAPGRQYMLTDGRRLCYAVPLPSAKEIYGSQWMLLKKNIDRHPICKAAITAFYEGKPEPEQPLLYLNLTDSMVLLLLVLIALYIPYIPALLRAFL